MFTGIVQGVAEVITITEQQDFRTHTLRLPSALLTGLEVGASVAQNGCCLTVTTINGDHVSFDLIRETLRVTNLGRLQTGDRVNIERAAQFGKEIGGHPMSGHILCLAKVVRIIEMPNNCTVWLELPTGYTKYVFTKGYIGIDGISLTIGEVMGANFCVHLIVETMKRTTIMSRKEGDLINIEFDSQIQATVETLERLIQVVEGGWPTQMK